MIRACHAGCCLQGAQTTDASLVSATVCLPAAGMNLKPGTGVNKAQMTHRTAVSTEIGVADAPAANSSASALALLRLAEPKNAARLCRSDHGEVVATPEPDGIRRHARSQAWLARLAAALFDKVMICAIIVFQVRNTGLESTAPYCLCASALWTGSLAAIFSIGKEPR